MMQPDHVPSASLILPPPPPAPGPAGQPSAPAFPPLGRSATFGSIASTQTLEPTIDDIQRDTIELKSLVAEAAAALTQLESLRDKVIDDAGGIGDLHDLSALTTGTGQKILALSAPLASVRARSETLGRLAEEGRAAATTIEVDRVTEELEVCKLDVAKAVELVRGLAWEELDGKPPCRARIEARTKRENPAMTPEMVEACVRQAEVGAGDRIAQLDVYSYAGRMAAENPFTELAHLVEAISHLHRGGFGETDTATRNKTLSGNTVVEAEYGKIDHEAEDLEAAPLRQAPSGASDDAGWDAVKSNPGLVGKIRTNWRDYLVRGGLTVAVLGTVIGLVTYETISANHKADANGTTTTTVASSIASSVVASVRLH